VEESAINSYKPPERRVETENATGIPESELVTESAGLWKVHLNVTMLNGRNEGSRTKVCKTIMQESVITNSMNLMFETEHTNELVYLVQPALGEV